MLGLLFFALLLVVVSTASVICCCNIATPDDARSSDINTDNSVTNDIRSDASIIKDTKVEVLLPERQFTILMKIIDSLGTEIMNIDIHLLIFFKGSTAFRFSATCQNDLICMSARRARAFMDLVTAFLRCDGSGYYF